MQDTYDSTTGMWEVRFRRLLNTNDGEDLALVKHSKINLLWAYGPWSGASPGKHMNRGVIKSLTVDNHYAMGNMWRMGLGSLLVLLSLT